MNSKNFHISIENNNQRYFNLNSTATNKKLLLLPFEHFHQKNYNLNSLTLPYSIPNEQEFYLKEVDGIIPTTDFATDKPEIKCSLSKSEYIGKVNEIKKHIQRGDIYEMNFCFDFYAENALIDPFAVFEKLYHLSKAPFSSLTKINDLYVICCSPERFLKKEGDKITSQPMKGTAPRNADLKIDEENKNQLLHSKKEQNENVMIVDLVRNDLSKIAQKGTVKVDELFGVKSFATVHQMISTVSCLNDNHTNDEIFEATFPMGSMTGAPKKKVLELINQYEKNARGIYSGTIGTIEPNGDFDLAVIIRSIVYDAKNKYLSFSVGSAITAGCDTEMEYEECLLKAKTMMEVLDWDENNV